jgi:Flp pilus assembly protein TadD
MVSFPRRIALTAFLGSLIVAYAAWADEPQTAKAAVAKPAVAVTISKETTYITEPLRKDGYVDYVAAIDRQCREGITPENNAAVLFWQAVGPAKIWQESRERHFQRLGMTPLPEKGGYFVDLEQYLAMQKGGAKAENGKNELETIWETDQDLWKMIDPLMRRPWSKREHPVIAAWLAANEKPLSLLIEASKRPRFYDLQIDVGKLGMICLQQPSMECFHGPGGVVRTLIVRAMLFLSEGKREKAWDDLLACHRLARLVGQSPLFSDALLANRMDESVCAGDQAFLQHVHLKSAEAAKMRADIERLPPMPTPGEKIDLAERYTFLDCVTIAARDGRASLIGLVQVTSFPSNKENRRPLNLLLDYSKQTPLEWDTSLRLGNAWFDRIAAATRLPTRVDQRKSLHEIEEDFRKLKKTIADADSLDKSFREDARKAIAERLGELMVCNFLSDIVASAGIDVSDRQAMRFELDKLSFTLAAYRADHNAYPAKLDDLKPKYVAAVPEDLCTGGPLRYQRKRDGYLLYSLGNNGRDDGGKGYDDREKGKDLEELAKTDEDWDDLAVVMPAPAEKQAKDSTVKTSELSASDSAIVDSLSKKIKQSVRELGYSEKTAGEFAQMTLDWKNYHGRLMLLALAKKLAAAKQDYAKQLLKKADLARIEAEAVDEFMEGGFFRIFPSDGHYSLEIVIKEKKANCIGFTQLFYVLGTTIGLETQPIFIPEMFEHPMPLGVSHVACLVRLVDGKVMMVDFATKEVSEPFVFEEHFREAGIYWELKDQRNLLGVHPMVQLLDQKGLLGCIEACRAADAIQAGHADEAVELLAKAIEKCPKNAMIRSYRGVAYYKLKRYDEGLADQNEAIQLDPKYTAAYVNRGECYVKLRQYERAAADCTKAIELNPKSPEVYCARGVVYMMLKENEKASADFEKALEINPKFGKAYLARGGLRAMLGQKEDARRDFKKAAELDPSLKKIAEKAARGIEE